MLRRKEMGDQEAEMAEIVEMEERVVTMNAAEAKIIKMKILDNQVLVVETKTVHKEGEAVGNSNATKGVLQGGEWGS